MTTNGAGSTSAAGSTGNDGSTGGGSADTASTTPATDEGTTGGNADSGTGASEGSAGSDGSTGSGSSGSGDSSGDGSSTGGFEVEGCGMCSFGEVCRANLAQQATYECVAIPDRCAAEANCDCAASLCEDPFVACSLPAQPNLIECICIAC